MPSQSNTKLVSHIDCPGGGQVWVEGTTLYVGHMRPTSGTTIIDIADPRAPKIAKIDVREGWHSHKVRVVGDIMIVNQEKFGKSGRSDIGGGIDIYDVSKPDAPKLITEWRTVGGGVHRFDFDGRYAYISPTAEGYVGNIVMILDLADPAKPVEVSRWWIPGSGRRAARPIRGAIGCRRAATIRCARATGSTSATGTTASSFSTSPTCRSRSWCRTTTPARLSAPDAHLPGDAEAAEGPQRHGRGRRGRGQAVAGGAGLHLDLRHHPGAAADSDLDVSGAGSRQRRQSAAGDDGCHQPSERFKGTIIPFAWFAQGLRLVDFADPFAPKEVGHFVPDAAPGADRPSSNDVTIDSRGLVYLVDRVNGVDVIETPAIG